MIKQIATWGIVALVSSLSGTVLADEDELSRKPTAAQIVERLRSPVPSIGGSGLRRGLRSVTVDGGTPTAPAAPAALPSIDLEVNFEFASARLTPDAKIVLDHLGQALLDPALVKARVQLIGHTDAKGSDAYNLKLSQLRAQAVADYLSARQGIAAQRLTAEGRGRSQLLDSDDPFNALNRRVQVINLGE